MTARENPIQDNVVKRSPFRIAATNMVNWTAANNSNVPVLALTVRYANAKKTI
jgi:hypothetical protein